MLSVQHNRQNLTDCVFARVALIHFQQRSELNFSCYRLLRKKDSNGWNKIKINSFCAEFDLNSSKCYRTYLKSNKFLVLKKHWIQNPVVGQYSLVFHSPNETSSVDFSIEKRFYFQENQAFCYRTSRIHEFPVPMIITIIVLDPTITVIFIWLSFFFSIN